MTQKEMLKTIISTLDKKKAESIQAIKISDLTILADYFIIASGTNRNQVQAIVRLRQELWQRKLSTKCLRQVLSQTERKAITVQTG
mgnify:CR=1 FL=1